jgi:hypothetical protein
MAITKNLFIDQGSFFAYTFTGYDENNAVLSITAGTSGYTASSQMRRSYYSSSSVPFEASITGSTGNIRIAISATASAALKPGRYVYDVEVAYPPNRVLRVLQGTVTVDPEATK